MKTFLAIVLCFCVGCGGSGVSVVSEQEKLAKRINDKMDLAEERAKNNEPSEEESRRRLKTGRALLKKIQTRSEQSMLKFEQLKLELRDIKKQNPLFFRDFEKRYPSLFTEKNDK